MSDLKWMLGSDFHIPYHNKRYMDLWWQVMDWWKPDVVDILGDLDDANACSRFSKNTPVEVEEAQAKYAPAIKQFFADIRQRVDGQVHYATGNHECFSVEDHRIVTKSGLRYLNEVSKGDLVLSTNDTGEGVWVPVEAVHLYPEPTEVYDVSSNGVRGRFTPNHRMYASPKKDGDYSYIPVEDAVGMGRSFHYTAARNSAPDADLSDDEIRLLAWCFTDSHVTKTGRQWIFYQSAPKEGRIRDLLSRLSIGFTEKSRDRDTTEICGKVLKAPPKTSYEFTVDASDIPFDVTARNVLPVIADSLSERQVRVFVEELEFTDGTTPTGANRSSVLYVSDEHKRHQVMLLLLRNGIQSTATEYRPGHWRLNITDKNQAGVYSNRSTTKKSVAENGVGCITVSTGRFFVEHDNAIHLTGNSRIDDYVDAYAPALRGLITPEMLWGTDTYGIELSYYNAPPVHRFGDIYVHHGPYALSKSGESVRKVIDDFNVSCIVGHSHRQASVFKTYELKDEILRGYEIGHMTDTRSSGMAYDRKHDWQPGFAIAHIENGVYPHVQLVSISPDYTCVVDGKLFKG